MDKMLVDRVAFSFFGLEIYWYAVIITGAILLSFLGLFFMLKRKGKNVDELLDLTICVLPLAILTARLFSVLFDANISIDDYFAFRQGGLSIIGAILGGLLGIGIFCLWRRKNFFDMSDLIAPFLLFSQAIGRWGNYFNQEIYGAVVTEASRQWFPYAVQIGAEWHQALFFYEFIFDIVGAVLLFTLLKTCRKRGVITCTYLMFYGAVRFFLEDLRAEEYVLKFGSLPISKIFSAVLFATGLIILVVMLVRHLVARHKQKNKDVNTFEENVDV